MSQNETKTELEEQFNSLFLEFCGKMQRLFVRLLVLLVISLFLFQGLLRIPSLRSVLSSAERYEGKPLPSLEVLLEKFTVR